MMEAAVAAAATVIRLTRSVESPSRHAAHTHATHLPVLWAELVSGHSSVDVVVVVLISSR